MSMFPNAESRIIRNEDGEVLGWDQPSNDDVDPDEFYERMSEAEVQGRVSGAVSSTVIHDHVEYDDQGNRTVVVDSEETWTKDLGICQWFALCENQATHTMTHPILGEVPICDRCQEKYDKL